MVLAGWLSLSCLHFLFFISVPLFLLLLGDDGEGMCIFLTVRDTAEVAVLTVAEAVLAEADFPVAVADLAEAVLPVLGKKMGLSFMKF